jgi:hypothetical protein
MNALQARRPGCGCTRGCGNAGTPRARRWLTGLAILLVATGAQAASDARSAPVLAAQATTATTAPSTSTAAPITEPVSVPPSFPVPARMRTDPDWRRIELHRNGAKGALATVTLGIPFPPGMLRDATTVRILDERGQSIPAHVEPTLYWHFRDGSIRAVRVQFRTKLDGDSRTLHFAIGNTDTRTVAGWPYVDGLVDNAENVRVPGVLATLSPRWMSASLVAGPQRPAVPPGAYDRYFATQFEWARALPRDNGAAWLFDRPTTLFQQYVRTGRADYLAAATESYRFYMDHIRRTAPPGWPLCGGGWSLGDVNVCDPKYVYIEPILLALALTGDDSEHDAGLIARMVGAWNTGGWNVPAGSYTSADTYFTERQTGLGLLSIVAAYEITGDKRYRRDIDDRLGWLLQHQQHNPDGLGDDGSWRNSWQVHEGDTYDPATDVRGASPWMTENIIDGLWHAWLATGDTRIPGMITAFGRYMERYGWVDLKAMAATGQDWRDPCSGRNGQISWYWSSAHADIKKLQAIQASDGWYSDAHNVEMMLPVAAARYFETDAAQRQALDRRLALLSTSYSEDCASSSATPRRFNWNNRGVGVVQWFMQQFEAQPSH